MKSIGAALIAAGIAVSAVLGYFPAIGHRRPPSGPMHETADFQSTMPVWEARVIAAGLVVMGGSLVAAGWKRKRSGG